MLISTPWPSNTLGTSAQMPFSLSPEATQQFPSQQTQFQHGSFPFPLLSYHLVELLYYGVAHLWIHLPRCLDTGLCYPAWFASTLQFVSPPWVFCILSGDIQRRVLQNQAWDCFFLPAKEIVYLRTRKSFRFNKQNDFPRNLKWITLKTTLGLKISYCHCLPVCLSQDRSTKCVLY